MEKAGWFGRQESLSVFAHQPRTTGGEGVIDLRLGRYQDVLKDVTCDAVICDPPYSARTHEGQRTDDTNDGSDRRDISYCHWDLSDVTNFMVDWSPRCNGWFAVMTSHDLAKDWEAAMQGC